MDALTVAAASGMKARLESLALLANNVANQASPGFKADREFYTTYISPDAQAPPGAGRGREAPLIDRHWTDFAQGSLLETGNLALRGPGFFLTQSATGENLLTRNGAFRLSPEGRLESQTGLAVLDESREPIVLDPSRPFDVGEQGEVRQQGAVSTRLAIVETDGQATLTKRDGLYFRFTEPAAGLRPATATGVLQGKTEAANSSPAEAAVRLIGVLRQFEMLQKAMQLGADMNRQAAEIARVSG